MRHRAAIASLTALLLTVSLAATALAGGWAHAVMDSPPDEPVAPNEPVTVGFTLLQHGKTPVDWGATQLVAINDDTGQEVSVSARQEGATGHWMAEVNLPTAGKWRYEVRHDLEIMSLGATSVTVGDAQAVEAGTSTPSLGIQPALLVAGGFLGLLIVAGLVAGLLIYRHPRPVKARA